MDAHAPAPSPLPGGAPTLASAAAADHIEGTSCGTTAKCADREGWPRMMPDDVQAAAQFGRTTLRGKPNDSDELLGWHGSDTLWGYGRADVLWGDHIATGQPTTQWNRDYGGPGNDFIRPTTAPRGSAAAA
jgi:hypothetical protein